MREVTASGQTVEEAVQSALEQLNTTRDRVTVKVIDEGSKGFLGLFGSKLAVVSVNLNKDPVKECELFLREVTENMGITINIESKVIDNQITFELSGDNIALLIGKRGQTLNALQYLTQLVANKDGKQFYRVILDAEGYRERREKTLEALAKKMADKAVRLNKKVALEPMPAFERKIIHTTLQDRPDVSTYSDGVEPHRYVVIKP